MRNLASGDLGIPLVVIQMGVTGLKKSMYILCMYIVYSDIVTYSLKINDGRYRMPNFVIRRASYALAKTLECEGSISSTTIWATIIHMFFSFIHPVDEFSFKEMSIMWAQSKISSCCLCVWCKSK